jgi:hypothetical protein
MKELSCLPHNCLILASHSTRSSEPIFLKLKGSYDPSLVREVYVSMVFAFSLQ